MGGHAMKNYGVERLTKEQYDEVLSALTITLPYKTVAIPSYRAKDSFGDCDLLTTATDEAFEKSLSKDFALLGKKKNGSVTSYALKYSNFPPFQFDLIKAREDSFKFHYNYLSYNDLGNLIGRVAAAFGFKFAHNGLYLLAWYDHKGEERSVVRVKEEAKTNDHAEHRMEKLFISNFNEALEFLGFDSLRFAQGFDTVDDILDFVASSKYFCKDFFLFENRNHDQRKRFLAMAKNYLDNKKDLMLKRVLADYKVDDNLLFFRSLYEDNLIDSDKRAQIDSFLAQENKTISDYLRLLNKKELAILAEPYKQSLVLEAKARIEEYFMKKDEESVQTMEFYEKGKDFFYSGLPKNLANLKN